VQYLNRLKKEKLILIQSYRKKGAVALREMYCWEANFYAEECDEELSKYGYGSSFITNQLINGAISE
jgi:hypothetical protein